MTLAMNCPDNQHANACTRTTRLQTHQCHTHACEPQHQTSTSHTRKINTWLNRTEACAPCQKEMLGNMDHKNHEGHIWITIPKHQHMGAISHTNMNNKQGARATRKHTYQRSATQSCACRCAGDLGKQSVKNALRICCLPSPNNTEPACDRNTYNSRADT